jgi:hypothetical protein
MTERFAVAYRLVFAYAFVRPESEQNSSHPTYISARNRCIAAKDMAERVHIDYEPLPAVSRAVDAIKAGAPVLRDEAPDNLCIDIEAGDAAATSIAFARAAHIVRLDTQVQRVTGVPPRAAHDRGGIRSRKQTTHTL